MTKPWDCSLLPCQSGLYIAQERKDSLPLLKWLLSIAREHLCNGRAHYYCWRFTQGGLGRSFVPSLLTLACFLRGCGACAWKWSDTESKTQSLTIWSGGADRQESSYSSHGAEAVESGAQRRLSMEEPANHAWGLWSYWEAPPSVSKEKPLASLHLLFLCYKKIIIPTPFIGINVKL